MSSTAGPVSNWKETLSLPENTDDAAVQKAEAASLVWETVSKKERQKSKKLVKKHARLERKREAMAKEKEREEEKANKGGVEEEPMPQPVRLSVVGLDSKPTKRKRRSKIQATDGPKGSSASTPALPAKSDLAIQKGINATQDSADDTPRPKGYAVMQHEARCSFVGEGKPSSQGVKERASKTSGVQAEFKRPEAPQRTTHLTKKPHLMKDESNNGALTLVYLTEAEKKAAGAKIVQPPIAKDEARSGEAARASQKAAPGKSSQLRNYARAVGRAVQQPAHPGAQKPAQPFRKPVHPLRKSTRPQDTSTRTPESSRPAPPAKLAQGSARPQKLTHPESSQPVQTTTRPAATYSQVAAAKATQQDQPTQKPGRPTETTQPAPVQPVSVQPTEQAAEVSATKPTQPAQPAQRAPGPTGTEQTALDSVNSTVSSTQGTAKESQESISKELALPLQDAAQESVQESPSSCPEAPQQSSRTQNPDPPAQETNQDPPQESITAKLKPAEAEVQTSQASVWQETKKQCTRSRSMEELVAHKLSFDVNKGKARALSCGSGGSVTEDDSDGEDMVEDDTDEDGNVLEEAQTRHSLPPSPVSKPRVLFGYFEHEEEISTDDSCELATSQEQLHQDIPQELEQRNSQETEVNFPQDASPEELQQSQYQAQGLRIQMLCGSFGQKITNILIHICSCMLRTIFGSILGSRPIARRLLTTGLFSTQLPSTWVIHLRIPIMALSTMSSRWIISSISSTCLSRMLEDIFSTNLSSIMHNRWIISSISSTCLSKMLEGIFSTNLSSTMRNRWIISIISTISTILSSTILGSTMGTISTTLSSTTSSILNSTMSTISTILNSTISSILHHIFQGTLRSRPTTITTTRNRSTPSKTTVTIPITTPTTRSLIPLIRWRLLSRAQPRCFTRHRFAGSLSGVPTVAGAEVPAAVEAEAEVVGVAAVRFKDKLQRRYLR
ncbi:hypothetical protein ACHAQA_007983 [Verticillium albo-atrum]